MATKNARLASNLEIEPMLKSGPPLTEAHKDLIRILARKSVQDFLREIGHVTNGENGNVR